MTGKHPGHGYIRDNHQAKDFPEGQEPVPAGLLQLPLLLKKQGYTLGGFGKWGLGPVGSTGDPLKQGFDRWFGYNCQAVAHNYYPTHLWDNDQQIKLDNPKFSAHQKLPADADPSDPKSYAGFAGKDYAPDLIGTTGAGISSKPTRIVHFSCITPPPCRTSPCKCRRIR